nr:hypothetical protein CFP56_50720 [Quercus suber]
MEVSAVEINVETDVETDVRDPPPTITDAESTGSQAGLAGLVGYQVWLDTLNYMLLLELTRPTSDPTEPLGMLPSELKLTRYEQLAVNGSPALEIKSCRESLKDFFHGFGWRPCCGNDAFDVEVVMMKK